MQAGSERLGEVFVDPVDRDGCVALYFEIPPEKIGLLQAILESYEGIGVLRTLLMDPLVLGLYTTRSILPDLLLLTDTLALRLGLRFYSESELRAIEGPDINFDILSEELVKC